MEQSGFFNSELQDDGTYDRVYLAEFFAEYFRSFIGNGVFANPSNCCQVMAKEAMTVSVRPGKAWMNGYIYYNTDNLELHLTPADGVLKRIDRVVLRLDFLKREIRAKVKQGDYAVTPVPPPIQRDADAYEIALADVFIEAGAISITQSKITNLRMNNEYCGVVTALLQQVDTTTLFNQYVAWYRENTSKAEQDIRTWKTQVETDFYAWLEVIRKALDGETAANLYRIKADRSIIHSIILSAVSWVGSTAPFTQTITVDGVTTNNVIEIVPSPPLTIAQAEDLAGAMILTGTQTTNSVTLYAYGDKPRTNIAVQVIVRGDV